MTFDQIRDEAESIRNTIGASGMEESALSRAVERLAELVSELARVSDSVQQNPQ